MLLSPWEVAPERLPVSQETVFRFTQLASLLGFRRSYLPGSSVWTPVNMEFEDQITASFTLGFSPHSGSSHAIASSREWKMLILYGIFSKAEYISAILPSPYCRSSVVKTDVRPSMRSTPSSAALWMNFRISSDVTCGRSDWDISQRASRLALWL